MTNIIERVAIRLRGHGRLRMDELRPGDVCDLTSCRTIWNEWAMDGRLPVSTMTAIDSQLWEVLAVQIETDECVRVAFEILDGGFPRHDTIAIHRLSEERP